jgi:hypothetical protein
VIAYPACSGYWCELQCALWVTYNMGTTPCLFRKARLRWVWL